MSGSSDNTSRVWNLQTLECLHVLEGHTDEVNSVAIKVATFEYFMSLVCSVIAMMIDDRMTLL